MERSDTIGELVKALSASQADIGGALKSSKNPFFQSTYADLASVWDACREPLSKNGLSVIQAPASDGPVVTVETVLAHSSGEWVSCTLSTHIKDTIPQAVGTGITYLRRYALAAMVGVAQVDDDGESAMGRKTVVETLGREQVGEIIGILDIAGVGEHEQQRWLAKLAKRYGVPAVHDIPVGSFESAKATISTAIDALENGTENS